jgi:hypothetical protein
MKKYATPFLIILVITGIIVRIAVFTNEAGNSLISEGVQGRSQNEKVIHSYPFTKISLFSEDLAWVEFSVDNEISTGVIDNTGNLIFHVKTASEIYTPFTDGYAYIVTKRYNDYDDFLIINNSG